MVNLAKYKSNISEAKEFKGGGSSLLPNGDYTVALTKFEENEEVSGKCTVFYEVQAGEYQGSEVRDFLNFEAEQSWQRDQAFSKIKSLFDATKTPVSDDASVLEGKRLVVTVKQSTGKKQRVDQDGELMFKDDGSPLFPIYVNITKYDSIGTASPAAQPSAGQAGAKKFPTFGNNQ